MENEKRSEDRIESRTGSQEEIKKGNANESTVPILNQNGFDKTQNNNISYSSPRKVVGGVMSTISDFVNDNLIIVRYGTVASIALLTAYGLSKTPIFHRYKNVSEIPSSFFSLRKIIHGRIVHIKENQSSMGKNGTESERSITCLVYHLSPISRLLNKSLFEFYLKNNPSSLQFIGRPLEESKSLLKIEIAGLKSPQPFFSKAGAEQPGEWLRQLAKNRTSVTCTLLARKSTHKKESLVDQKETVAVCRLAYRPTLLSIFRKDLGSSLVSFGRAGVASGIFIENENKNNNMSTVDASNNLNDLKNDVKYMENLGKLEYDAVKNSRGMWADQIIRDSRPDLVEEAEFEASANILQKLWRRLFQ